ncbi:acetate kinase [Clostridium sp. AM58-1XD]|uniref:acetate/propionate family kinase n=1 Tax=Clostridium sp. AM58-1XD TaxID=2292307 RepID=UPI000E4F3668|nr:acetate kinase [Clostridium sp. AM58-1XD]RGY95926.1 acetate kinase [Clostridium sp. AM58-1XD]
MKILVLNCGSSSLKYQLLDMDNEEVLAKGLCERIGIDGSKLTHKPEGKDTYEVVTELPDHEAAIKLVMDTLVDPVHGVIGSVDEISAVGHRVVHGGQAYSSATLITPTVKKVIRDCFDLSPLHNPANMMGIDACEAAMPGIPNVAVFDTAFGQSMDEKAFIYALPYEYYEKYGIRRYGFHGISHSYVSKEAVRFAGLNYKTAKVVVCHLGNGASVSASIGGKCIDTSMGLTPLQGSIMGTRSGSIDPTIIQYICHKEGRNVDAVMDILNKQSGILGISGISSDFRDVQAAQHEGNHRADVAIQSFVYRIAKYVGSYITAMNGVDIIAFTAGVGENDKEIRKAVCDYLGYLGIKIDDAANDMRGKERIISTPDSKVVVAAVPTNEELAIARQTLALVQI